MTCRCGEVEQLKQDYDEIDTALMELAEEHSRLKKASTRLLADREALVRYVVARRTLAICSSYAETGKCGQCERHAKEAYEALSRELKDMINV